MSTIAKRGDLLPVWTAAKGASGYYGPNSVVFYQKKPELAGYAYRAKSTYISSNIPPDEDSNWEIDYTYSNKWVAGEKYKYGSRVYYFNGQYTYAYVASLRYFGGSGKPNEEVDEDGIRTWELEVTYNPHYYYTWYYNGSIQPTFLFPVRKVAGYVGGNRAWHYNVLFPEERYEGKSVIDYDGNYLYINEALNIYLYEKNYIKKDYSDWNSKYQSFAYDPRTYKFTEDKSDSKGNFIPLKKGIHYAKWRKKNSESNGYTAENPNPYQHAESQFFHTIKYSWGYFAEYFDINGFAIEMWPNIQDDEFALVPSTNSSNDYYFYWNYNEGVRYYPVVNFSGDGHDPYGSGWAGTGGFPYPKGGNGGYGGPQPPDEECRASLVFMRRNPAFSDLNCTYCFNVHTYNYKWEPYDVYCSGPPPYNIPYVCDVEYTLVDSGEPVVSFIEESATTKDKDFKCTDDTTTINGQTYTTVSRQHFVRSVQQGDAVNFSSYKKPMAVVSIGFAGWRVK
jgi:hypothetical protein